MGAGILPRRITVGKLGIEAQGGDGNTVPFPAEFITLTFGDAGFEELNLVFSENGWSLYSPDDWNTYLNDMGSDCQFEGVFIEGTIVKLSGNLSLVTILYLSNIYVEEIEYSKLINLTELYADSTMLTAISFEGITQLSHLKLDFTGITAVDLTQFVATQSLRSVSLSGMQLTGVLDMDDHAGMTYLNCVQNDISELRLSGCSGLIHLLCGANNIEELDLNACVNLTNVDCSANILTSLILDACVNLTSLNASNNNLAWIIDLSSNTSLKVVALFGNEIIEVLGYENWTIDNLSHIMFNANPLTLEFVETIMQYFIDNAAYPGTLFLNGAGAPNIEGNLPLESLVYHLRLAGSDARCNPHPLNAPGLYMVFDDIAVTAATLGIVDTANVAHWNDGLNAYAVFGTDTPGNINFTSCILAGNSIRLIGNLGQIERLWLENLGIDMILMPPYGLDNITLIGLTANNLQAYTHGTKIDSLQGLHLVANPLTSAPENIFGNALAVLGMSDCNLSAANVNALLADGVANAITGVEIDLTGANAAPTGQGLIDKADLIAAGNIVDTNV